MSGTFYSPPLDRELRIGLHRAVDKRVRELVPYLDDDDNAETHPKRREPQPQQKLMARLSAVEPSEPVPGVAPPGMASVAKVIQRRLKEERPAPGTLAALAVERGRELVRLERHAHPDSLAALALERGREVLSRAERPTDTRREAA